MSSSRTKSGGRARAPRGSLNRAVIVATASNLVDTEGLAALTTRRLADELGVVPMALYTHFPDKHAILRAVAEDLFGRFELPTAAATDLDLFADVLRAYFQLLVDHPVLLELDRLLDTETKSEAAFSEVVYACLRRLDIDFRTTVGLVATGVRFVVGSAKLFQSRRDWDDDPDYWERRRRRMAALPADTYPSLHELTEDFPVFSQRDAFEFGLATLLAAVAAAANA